MSMMFLCDQHALALPFFIFLTKDIIHYIVAFTQSGIDFYCYSFSTGLTWVSYCCCLTVTAAQLRQYNVQRVYQ